MAENGRNLGEKRARNSGGSEWRWTQLEKIQALATKSDFETLSLKGIRKKLSEELKQDVTPYKKKIKMLVIETMQANAAAAPTEAS